MSKSQVIHNLEQLAEAIGSYMGMMEGLGQQEYMDSLISKVHSDVAPEFDKAAAAKAMGSNSGLSHMWEYGTAGITRGKVKYANPTSQAAMLWQHRITGKGKTKTIGYVFRPAKSIVPPLTTESTGGVDQKVLDKLAVNTGKRRYKFPNKAYIYESGTDVKLLPQRSKSLFIPIGTEGMPEGVKDRAGAERRGYAWAKAHTYSPGDFADSTGRFTGFFGGWWSTVGAELMEDGMKSQVERDLISVDKTIKPSKRMTSAQRANIKAAMKRGESKTRKQFTLKTRHELGERAEVIL